MLICGFCGKKYGDSDLDGYVSCVNKCSNQKKKELDDRRNAEKKAEKENRWNELIALDKQLEEKTKAFCKDYNVAWPFSASELLKSHFICRL